jgi:hypothetical protein
MIGWCGDPSEVLELRVYADADFAGCVRAMRSTARVILAATGPNARMILNGVSERQTAVSHSTPEAEIVAADNAMRAEGMPALTLLETIFERKVHLCMMEDDEAMIKICHSGENPTLRYFNRTHKVGVSWLMDVINLDEIDICEIDAKLQAADIGANTWRSNCVLINLCEPDDDPTAQRALLLALRNETVDKLADRKETQRVEALERLEAIPGPTANSRGGGGSIYSRVRVLRRT